MLHVNLCQKLLFLPQLTHNMTTDCSLNYEFSAWKYQAQNMSKESSVHKLFLFLHSEQFMYTTCSWHVLSLEFSYTELVIQWTICGLVEARIRVLRKIACNLRGLGTLGKVSLWQNWQTRLCIYVHPKADAYLRS